MQTNTTRDTRLGEFSVTHPGKHIGDSICFLLLRNSIYFGRVFKIAHFAYLYSRCIWGFFFLLHLNSHHQDHFHYSTLGAQPRVTHSPPPLSPLPGGCRHSGLHGTTSCSSPNLSTRAGDPASPHTSPTSFW